MPATRLQAARIELGWKAAAVLDMLPKRGEALGVTVMSPSSLKTKLSEWENGRTTPSEQYRRLFRDIYGRTNQGLGFPPEQEQHDEASELRERLAVARSVDADTVAAFRRQVDAVRFPDRKFGGLALLDDLRGTVEHVEGMLDYSTAGGHREAIAATLTEASTLAGWLALDRNAVGQAWDHYERAKHSAREAGSAGLRAHAIAEQAFVLIDIGETAAAVEQLASARALADHAVSPLLGAWLAAAHGEGLAATGQRSDALRAFDAADALLPADPVDPQLPFIFLGGSHLDRWRGNALVRLGDPEATDHLAEALERLPEAFTRARVGLLVDLAHAYAATGDRAASQYHARQARRLGQQIKSDRHLRRLSAV